MRLSVHTMGEAARAALARPGEAVLLAVFDRSFYLDRGGRIACVGSRGLGGGPLNALCDLPEGLSWADLGVCAGQSVRLRHDSADVGGLRLDWREVAYWFPPSLPTGVDASDRPAVLARGLRRLGDLAASAPEVAGNPGLTALTPWLAGDAPAPGGTALLERAVPAVTALRAWLGAAPESAAPAGAVAALLGAGPGLTPSGDDVLAGILVGCRTFGEPGRADALAAAVLAGAPERTGVISAAHLRCAAAGAAGASVHRVLVALATGAGSGLDDAVASLAAVGHSSGRDLLAGIACALRAAIDREVGRAK